MVVPSRQSCLSTVFKFISGNRKIYAFIQILFLSSQLLRTTIAVDKENLDTCWTVRKLVLWNFTIFPEVQFELLSSITFILGVYIIILYGYLVLNSVYWLVRIQRCVGRTVLCMRNVWLDWRNSLVVVATGISILNAIWFSIFVRETWVARLGITVQVLQVIPVLIIIADTILNGCLVCAESALTNRNPIISCEDYQSDIGTHKGANVMLVMYAVLNLLVVFKSTTQESTVTKLFPLFVALEFLSRPYIVYELGRRAALANVGPVAAEGVDEGICEPNPEHSNSSEESDYFSCDNDNDSSHGIEISGSDNDSQGGNEPPKHPLIPKLYPSYHPTSGPAPFCEPLCEDPSIQPGQIELY